jgi:putative aldouronate transport system substrate-binding protein
MNIRNDILSENVDGIDEAEKGYILWGHGYYDKTSESTESTKKGFATKVFGLGDKYYIKNNIPATSTCIARTCDNPARAMKVIDLMNTKKGKDLYNMLVYGLEGKHYKKVSDNRIETLGYVTYADADSLYGLNKWAVGNTSNAYETQVDPEGYADYVRSLDDNAQILPTVGFKPDVSEISVEIAQVATVTKEYAELTYGALPNYQEVYNEYMEKLKTAGALKIRDELQKQLGEWLEKNKK